MADMKKEEGTIRIEETTEAEVVIEAEDNNMNIEVEDILREKQIKLHSLEISKIDHTIRNTVIRDKKKNKR